MRIVFIIDQMHSHGGIERVLSIKANYLAAQDDIDVHIITSEQNNKKYTYDLHNAIVIEDIGINYHRTKSYFHPANLIKLPTHILRLRKKLKTLKPDVVVVCSHGTDTYFVPFINKRIPKVKEFHYSKYIEGYLRNSTKITFKTLFLRFADYVESKYDRLVVLNDSEASYYKTNNIAVIPNPLTFYPDKVSDLKENTVISVGRIAPVKGYEQLIDIWEIVTKEQPDWQLHIYGDGDAAYIQSLQDKIDAKNLEKTFLLKGATNHVKEAMVNSSIFAMTSHNECFPLVLLEAQVCGLPIISFDCPHGPRNIINADNGLLIELGDSNGFATQLISLINTNHVLQEMGKNARDNASKYLVKDVMGQWLSMFNEVIQ